MIDLLALPLRDRLLWQQAFRALDDNDVTKLQEALDKGASINAMRPAMVERNGKWLQTQIPETLASCALRHGKFDAWVLLNNHAKRIDQELKSDDDSFCDSILSEVWTQMGKHCPDLRNNLMDHSPYDHPALMCLREFADEWVEFRKPTPGVMGDGWDPMEEHERLLTKWIEQCKVFDQREELKAVVIDRPPGASKVI